MSAVPIISGVLGIAGAITGGNQQDAQIESQRAQMFAQAEELDVNAASLRREGSKQESMIREQGRTFTGQQIGVAAGSGVTTEGSVMDALRESAYNIEADALTTREKYFEESRSKQRSAENLRKGVPQSSSGIGTLLSAAGAGVNAYSQWKGFQS